MPYRMSQNSYARFEFASAVIMIAIDATYLYFLGGPSFARMVESIQDSKFKLNIFGAAASYLLMLYGLHYFVLTRKSAQTTTDSMIRDSAVLGLVIYGVFDSTNIAMFSKYKLGMAVVDTLWGVFLFSTTTYLTLQYRKYLS